MLATLVALISLSLTTRLVGHGAVQASFPITAATVTTPITVTSPALAAALPMGRRAHAVVSGIVGTTEANGTWVLTPQSDGTFALSSFTPQGAYLPSVGANAYVSGGTIQVAFPDYQILLGQRNKSLSTAGVPPRILFVPCVSRAFDFEPYGGVGQPAPFDPGTSEVQAEYLGPQLATEFPTFDVFVTNSTKTAQNPTATPDPDFGDFEATQTLYQQLTVVIVNGTGCPRGRMLQSYWPSQLPANHPLATGTQSQLGQQWCGRFEFQQPIFDTPETYTTAALQFEATTVSGGSSDDTTFTVG
jgi:hypothetical protein